VEWAPAGAAKEPVPSQRSPLLIACTQQALTHTTSAWEALQLRGRRPHANHVAASSQHQPGKRILTDCNFSVITEDFGKSSTGKWGQSKNKTKQKKTKRKKEKGNLAVAVPFRLPWKNP